MRGLVAAALVRLAAARVVAVVAKAVMAAAGAGGGCTVVTKVFVCPAPKRVGFVILAYVQGALHVTSDLHVSEVAAAVGPVQPPAVDNQVWVGGVGRRDEDIGAAHTWC